MFGAEHPVSAVARSRARFVDIMARLFDFFACYLGYD